MSPKYLYFEANSLCVGEYLCIYTYMYVLVVIFLPTIPRYSALCPIGPFMGNLRFAEEGHLFRYPPLVKFSNLSEMTLLFRGAVYYVGESI